MQTSLAAALKTAGFTVLTASDGQEGMGKIKSEMPNLVLLDLILPEKDGYRILYEVKEDEKLKKIPVIVITAISSDTSESECMFQGAVDYLEKTKYTLNEVVRKVKKYLKK